MHIWKRNRDLHLIITIFVTALLSNSINAQSFAKSLQEEKAIEFSRVEEYKPFTLLENQKRNAHSGILGTKTYLNISSSFQSNVLSQKEQYLSVSIPLTSKKTVRLNLEKVNVLAPGFILKNSKNEILPEAYQGQFYWGYVEGHERSTAVVNVFKNEVSIIVGLENQTYSLVKLANSNEYIVYDEATLQDQPEKGCFTDELKQSFVNQFNQSIDRSAPNEENCVKVYVEVDHNLYLSKGSNVTNTYNYVSGAFSQVAILYANENINFTVSEMKIWDEVDPYTGLDSDGNGPSSGTYLNQFRSALLGTNWNGDLAHLVGNNGGGGVAYVNVICAPNYAFGYSGIGNSYNDVPTYSWTVEVLTHELGHNLGSPHTHACRWNDNNTQIDDCGNKYFAEDGNPDTNPNACYDAPTETIPAKGTIMSYCHLLSGVGIDFNLGFGPQPGDLIRGYVYNASCLGPCEDCVETGNPCDDGNACTTNDVYDDFCNCSGTPVPDNDNDGVCNTLDPDDNNICIPNPCTDCTLTTITINFDQYPGETTWQIRNSSDEIVISGPTNAAAGQTETVQVCLPDGCYDFIIYDSYGDGICCGYGQGSYQVTDADGAVLASGGSFTSSESTNFCYSNFTGCTDLDEDDICDDVDPCYDPMINSMGEMLTNSAYHARQQIILLDGTSFPENATIFLNAPTVIFSENITVPVSTEIILNTDPCTSN